MMHWYIHYFRIIIIVFRTKMNKIMWFRGVSTAGFLLRIALIRCCSHNKLPDAILGDKFYNSFFNAVHFNVQFLCSNLYQKIISGILKQLCQTHKSISVTTTLTPIRWQIRRYSSRVLCMFCLSISRYARTSCSSDELKKNLAPT